jgi:hypothetical protein
LKSRAQRNHCDADTAISGCRKLRGPMIQTCATIQPVSTAPAKTAADPAPRQAMVFSICRRVTRAP